MYKQRERERTVKKNDWIITRNNQNGNNFAVKQRLSSNSIRMEKIHSLFAFLFGCTIACMRACVHVYVCECVLFWSQPFTWVGLKELNELRKSQAWIKVLYRQQTFEMRVSVCAGVSEKSKRMQMPISFLSDKQSATKNCLGHALFYAVKFNQCNWFCYFHWNGGERNQYLHSPQRQPWDNDRWCECADKCMCVYKSGRKPKLSSVLSRNESYMRYGLIGC